MALCTGSVAGFALEVAKKIPGDAIGAVISRIVDEAVEASVKAPEKVCADFANPYVGERRGKDTHESQVHRARGMPVGNCDIYSPVHPSASSNR